MSDVKSNQFDLKKIAEDVSKRPAPSSCETIAQLLSNLPVKSWIHRQSPTAEQNQAFELMKEKSKAPTPEEIRFMAEVCCCKYHRIRAGAWNWPQWDKAIELYTQYYNLTNDEEVKYILDHFDEFKKLCYQVANEKQRTDDLAPYKNTGLSTSRDPDSDEWKN